MHALRRVSVALAALLVVSGCGDTPSGRSATVGTTSSTSPSPAPGGDVSDLLSRTPAEDPADATWRREIFHFMAEDGSIVSRSPWAACLGNSCWDGAPHLAGPVPSAGSPEALWFAFSYPGWDFEHVSFHPVGDECGARVIDVAAHEVGDRLFRIDPAGLAGDWRVDVFGRGADGGDASASVRWTTSTDGAMPAPRAIGALFFDDDGQRVTYGGPTLAIEGLASTPRTATGTWTVTDASGTSFTVPLTREEQACTRAGAVSLSGPEPSPDRTSRLQGPNLTYTVDVRLERVTYTGTAVWDQRTSGPDEQALELTFDPPLPAYTG